MTARLAAFASRIGLTGLTIAVLLALLAVQTVRLEGFKVWPLSVEGAITKAAKQAELAEDERKAHAVTRASLDNLEQRLAVFIADGKRRSEAAERAVEAQRERSAALDAQIARMRSVKPSAAEIERCETPASVIGAEGL
jgi:hypothetical protein